MIPIIPAVSFVTLVPQIEDDAPRDYPSLPTAPFADVWERDGVRWLMGPMILADVVRYLNDRAPMVVFPTPWAASQGRIDMIIPLPDLRDFISGEMQSVVYAIPEELRTRFLKICDRVLGHFRSDAEALILRLSGSPLDRFTIHRANVLLRGWENERLTEDSQNCLYKVAAAHFGLNWSFLPGRAFVEDAYR